MFGKLAIRNIPKEIVDALEQSATLHDRSMEAEARQALRAWVEPLSLAKERNSRRAEVAERLNRLLDELNAVRHPKFRPSHVAQAIGEDRAGSVEDWFLGIDEPTFAQLAAIAKVYGADAEWLIHGDNRMFPVESFRLPEDPTEAVNWLTTWTPGEPVSAVYLVREKDKTGSLLIVKESKNEQFTVYNTPVHVSEEIGAGGEAMLAYLSVTLELLYKRYTRGRSSLMVFSYILEPAKFERLANGTVYPKAVLRDAPKLPWWEDIWDRSMYPKGDYWPGWLSLCERIDRVVESKTHLREQQGQIRKGTHPAIFAR